MRYNIVPRPQQHGRSTANTWSQHDRQAQGNQRDSRGMTDRRMTGRSGHGVHGKPQDEHRRGGRGQLQVGPRRGGRSSGTAMDNVGRADRASGTDDVDGAAEACKVEGGVNRIRGHGRGALEYKLV